MQIAKVRVQNFRSLNDVEIQFSDYTSFIGPNGAGKSTVLYAIAWFFGVRDTIQDDLRIGSSERKFSVEVEFDNLTDRDRTILGEFAASDCVWLKRETDFEADTDLWLGQKLLWNDGQTVLSAATAQEQISAYEKLREAYPDLAELQPKTGKRCKELVNEYAADEATPKNPVEVPASNLFAPNGPIRELIDLILVEGAADLATEMDGIGKKTVLHEMTSRLVDSNRKNAVNEWKEDHLAEVLDLENRTLEAVQGSLGWHQNVISKSLARYVPGATVEFEAGEIKPSLDVNLQITPTIRWQGREPERIGSQGHGTQRALMMAMVESLALSRREGREEEGPVLLLLVEEPEIFQHPTRARHFANQLFKMAVDSGFQVITATHSQHFVSEKFFESLQLVRHGPTGSMLHTASVDTLAAKVQYTADKVRKALLTEMPRGVAEGFFADAVILVEGITDKVILEALAEKDGYPMDQYGIAVIDCGTKIRVPLFTRLFEQFGIPTFFVIDGDFSDLDQADTSKKKQARIDHERQTRECVQLLEVTNPSTEAPYFFGDETLLTDIFSVFCRSLESELDDWASFHDAMIICNPSGETKNPYHYRAATNGAALEDSPDSLRGIIQNVRRLADQALGRP